MRGIRPSTLILCFHKQMREIRPSTLILCFHKLKDSSEFINIMFSQTNEGFVRVH